MSTAANNLIERLELETEQRIDDPDSTAMLGLLGAMSRKLGESPATYTESEDVAAGIMIAEQMRPGYKEEQAARAAYCLLMCLPR